MRIAIIPARKGSKRIKNKNIKLFNNKPLVYWTINNIKKSKIFDRVIVSTDCKKITKIVNSYGAETPFIRPDYLSDDITGTSDVIKHCLNSINIDNNDSICCIYPTSIFLKSYYLRKGLQKLNKRQFNFIISVTTYDYPIQRSLIIDENYKVRMFSPKFEKTRTQDLRTIYHDAGQFYWGKASSWLQNKSILKGKTSSVYIPRYLVQDIDDKEDWIKAEIMFNFLKKNNLK
jgi:N-acylneuraminate cytidylyltransferase